MYVHKAKGENNRVYLVVNIDINFLSTWQISQIHSDNPCGLPASVKESQISKSVINVLMYLFTYELSFKIQPLFRIKRILQF